MNTILKLKITKIRTKLVDIFKQLKEILVRPKTDDKTGDKTDGEQPGITDMPDLDSEQSAEQRRNKKGKGFKILTTGQMLSRLPITLAQLKAGNNSEKLKNEIRQLLYSLHRSKKLTKTIHNNLISAI